MGHIADKLGRLPGIEVGARVEPAEDWWSLGGSNS